MVRDSWLMACRLMAHDFMAHDVMVRGSWLMVHGAWLVAHARGSCVNVSARDRYRNQRLALFVRHGP